MMFLFGWLKPRIEEERSDLVRLFIKQQRDKLARVYSIYSDEIPLEMVHSTSAQKNFKCRGNYVSIVTLVIEMVNQRVLLSEEIMIIWKKYPYSNFPSKMTNPKEIAGLNYLVQKLLFI